MTTESAVISSIQIRIPYADTDHAGAVYYSNYLTYFERGRTEWIRGQGITYRELEKMGFYLPVSETSCKYIAPVRYDDVITVRTWLSEKGHASLKFEYEILVGENTVASGMTKHPIVNRDFRPVRMPGELKKILENKQCQKR